ncbi:MAG: hypothetical protein Q7P63_00995 [Verrucomicrobiota bacterium JB022]|nr:hypothetical protein [Verrucomicrobiota bacterium JB022]
MPNFFIWIAMRLLVKKAIRFYFGFFLLAFVVGHVDLVLAISRKDVNDYNRPLLALPGALMKWDGGTRYWLGLGYVIIRRNEIIFEDGDTIVSNYLHGWELRPWPIFRIPFIGNSLFAMERLDEYRNLKDPFDLTSAEFVVPSMREETLQDERFWEDVRWVVSGVGFVLLFLFWRLFAWLYGFLKHRGSRRGQVEQFDHPR